MKRRRRRKIYRKHQAVKVKRSITPFIIAICFSVAAGYVTATYLIGPALGLEPQVTFSDFLDEDKKDAEKETQNTEATDKTEQTETVLENTGAESGFALQYGSFSTEEGARECADDLKKQGISTDIIKKEGMFKVIGEVFDTKDEAGAQKEKSEIKDVFITQIP